MMIDFNGNRQGVVSYVDKRSVAKINGHVDIALQHCERLGLYLRHE